MKKRTTTTNGNARRASTTPPIDTKGMKQEANYTIYSASSDLSVDLFSNSKGNMFIERQGLKSGRFVHEVKRVSQASAFRDWMRHGVPECWQARLLKAEVLRK